MKKVFCLLLISKVRTVSKRICLQKSYFNCNVKMTHSGRNCHIKVKNGQLKFDELCKSVLTVKVAKYWQKVEKCTKKYQPNSLIILFISNICRAKRLFVHQSLLSLYFIFRYRSTYKTSPIGPFRCLKGLKTLSKPGLSLNTNPPVPMKAHRQIRTSEQAVSM